MHDQNGTPLKVGNEVETSNDPRDEEDTRDLHQDPKAESGTCTPAKSWMDALLYFGAFIAILIVGWFVTEKIGENPSPKASPVEYTADFFTAENDQWQRMIDARRSAVKWAKEQAMTPHRVDCKDGGTCEVAVPGNTWVLFCAPDCRILQRSYGP